MGGDEREDWYIRLEILGNPGISDQEYTLSQLMNGPSGPGNKNNSSLDHPSNPSQWSRTNNGLVLGRQSSSSIGDRASRGFNSPIISRRHALLQVDDRGRVFVTDLGSLHGTKINDRELSRTKTIQILNGDVLVLGRDIHAQDKRHHALRARVHFKYPKAGVPNSSGYRELLPIAELNCPTWNKDTILDAVRPFPLVSSAAPAYYKDEGVETLEPPSAISLDLEESTQADNGKHTDFSPKRVVYGVPQSMLYLESDDEDLPRGLETASRGRSRTAKTQSATPAVGLNEESEVLYVPPALASDATMEPRIAAPESRDPLDHLLGSLFGSSQPVQQMLEELENTMHEEELAGTFGTVPMPTHQSSPRSLTGVPDRAEISAKDGHVNKVVRGNGESANDQARAVSQITLDDLFADEDRLVTVESTVQKIPLGVEPEETVDVRQVDVHNEVDDHNNPDDHCDFDDHSEQDDHCDLDDHLDPDDYTELDDHCDLDDHRDLDDHYDEDDHLDEDDLIDEDDHKDGLEPDAEGFQQCLNGPAVKGATPGNAKDKAIKTERTGSDVDTARTTAAPINPVMVDRGASPMADSIEVECATISIKVVSNEKREIEADNASDMEDDTESNAEDYSSDYGQNSEGPYLDGSDQEHIDEDGYESVDASQNDDDVNENEREDAYEDEYEGGDREGESEDEDDVMQDYGEEDGYGNEDEGMGDFEHRDDYGHEYENEEDEEDEYDDKYAEEEEDEDEDEKEDDEEDDDENIEEEDVDDEDRKPHVELEAAPFPQLSFAQAEEAIAPSAVVEDSAQPGNTTLPAYARQDAMPKVVESEDDQVVSDDSDSSAHSSPSTEGPITPPSALRLLKRHIPEEFEESSDESPAKVAKVIERPAEAARRTGGTMRSVALVALGMAVGSVGTIAGLMRLAD